MTIHHEGKTNGRKRKLKEKQRWMTCKGNQKKMNGTSKGKGKQNEGSATGRK